MSSVAKKLDLIRLMAFLSEIYDTNWIKVGCTRVHILGLPQWKRHWDATMVT